MSNHNLQQLREERKPVYRNLVRWIWRLFIVGILALVLLFVGLSFTDLPDTAELENPKSELASEVIAADGSVLGRYFIENRVPVEFEELSPYIEQALIATEDERYYNHSGIDFKALARAVVKTGLMGDKSAGGASTITQQLAKLLFTGRPGSGFERLVQKLKEWIIAVRLERKYTKEEIIKMYLNKFDFLYDSHGIKAASETYFAKSQKDLNIEEAAMLVGMLKNPALYNPKRFKERAIARRAVVLGQMLRNDIIDQAAFDTLKTKPLDISKFKRKTHTQGLAQYFRSELAQELNKVVLPGNSARKKADGTPYNIYKDGLKIWTTIDPAIQRHAEEAMVAHMTQLQSRFWKRWKAQKVSPWEYEHEEVTTPAELRFRKRKLELMVRASDRYQLMRSKMISDPEQALEDEIDGLRMNDDVIEWMLKDKYPSAVKGEQRARYRRAMKSEKWNELRTAWSKFRDQVDKAFNRETKMKVFAYNDAMESDTVMTPLDSIRYHHSFMQLGSLAVDPMTGHVKAWVGGINHKYFAYDHIRSNRQVGSTFKPFIYATAIAQQGVSPCSEVTDMQRTIFANDRNFGLIEDWTPENSTGKYSNQKMRLRDALRKSINTVSVFLMQQLGSVQPVTELLTNMGVREGKVPELPSICLGAADLSVMDMTGAYTTFANNGYYTKPIYITRIEDKNGVEIYAAEKEGRQALEEEPNYVMVEMLKYAGGTAMGGIRSEIGGKTGTTNDYVDGWYMGITPSLVVGTWVGGEDRWIRFLNLRDGAGSRMAKPFCKEFISRLEKDETCDYNAKARFTRPRGDLSIGLDCNDFLNNDLEEEEDLIEPDSTFYEDPFGG
ncbi:MAG: transglycosylase domain-containing protein [Bacteroidota bacterium]